MITVWRFPILAVAEAVNRATIVEDSPPNASKPRGHPRDARCGAFFADVEGS